MDAEHSQGIKGKKGISLKGVTVYCVRLWDEQCHFNNDQGRIQDFKIEGGMGSKDVPSAHHEGEARNPFNSTGVQTIHGPLNGSSKPSGFALSCYYLRLILNHSDIKLNTKT